MVINIYFYFIKFFELFLKFFYKFLRSLGVTFYFMLFGDVPFKPKINSKFELYQLIKKG